MRMRQLDALRALAVGLVMVEHFGGERVNQYFPIGAGTIGVDCFFVLSGFLITGILLEGFDRHRDDRLTAWRIFYTRRFLRLVPAFYAVILALVLIGIEPIASSWPWHAAYLTNIWIALGNPSNIFWSLAVEEQFYLFWPFVIAFAPRRYLPALTIALVATTLALKGAVVAAGIPTAPIRGLLPINIELLALGCLLAIASYRNGKPNDFAWYSGPTAFWFTTVAWTALGLAVGSWAAFGDGSDLRFLTNNLLLAIFFAWVVLRAAIGFKGVAGKVFDNPALQYLGLMSYGLYLVHNWMPDIVERIVGPMPKWQAGPIVLAATFAVCALSWHFFEKPILNWGRPKRAEPSAPVVADPPVEIETAGTSARG